MFCNSYLLGRKRKLESMREKGYPGALTSLGNCPKPSILSGQEFSPVG